MSDLLLLVADKNIQFSLRGGLDRPRSLGICEISAEFIVHPNRDGGVRTTGAQLAALERSQHEHCLMILDYEGSGAEALGMNAKKLEARLDEDLSIQWGAKGKAIVIEPELDIWMWGSDNALKEVLGWSFPIGIREWLKERGFEIDENEKPVRPKEAMEAVFRACRRPRSSAAYEEITRKISLAKCGDPAFARLKNQLQLWYSAKA